MYEVVNIHFRQVWHFDVKGIGWVGTGWGVRGWGTLSVVLTQTVGRFDIRLTLTQVY